MLIAGAGAFIASKRQIEEQYRSRNSQTRRSKATNASNQAYSIAMGVAVVTLFMLQPAQVKQFAEIFSCIELGAEGTGLYLRRNLNIQCYSGQHWVLMLGLGLPLLLGFVIGVPLALYKLLSNPHNFQHILLSNRRQKLLRNCNLQDLQSLESVRDAEKAMDQACQTFQTNFGFLFLGYQDSLYLWEIVVMARKGCLSIIAVTFVQNPSVQVMLGLLVSQIRDNCSIFIFICIYVHL